MDRKRYSWKMELAGILKAHNNRAANRDKNIGTETMNIRRKNLYLSFEDLRALGYKIENPRNLKETHVRVLAEHWEEKGLSASTIQNRISTLRTFSVWIGKQGMIKDSTAYVKNPVSVTRSQVTKEDKSWSGNDIDFDTVFKQLEDYDQKAAAQLLVIRAFGLRRKEAVSFRPHIALRLGERFNDILVEFGTKGGRARSVPIETEEQKHALEYAKNLARTSQAHIGWEELTIEQAVKKFSNIMQRFGITRKDKGVTAHGLRHEYAHDKYQRQTGVPSPVRGGKHQDIDPETDHIARMQTSQALGHGRVSVTPAYYGSNGRRRKTKKPESPVIDTEK